MVLVEILVNLPNDQNAPELSLHCANSFAAATKALRSRDSVAAKPSERIRFDPLNANGDCGFRLHVAGRSVPRPCRRRGIQPSWTVAEESLLAPAHIPLELIIFTPAMMTGR
jgi:hypothetical protein